MNVRTSVDPDHAIASITFPVNQLDKAECSVKKTIRVELTNGEVFIDINYKGQLLGLEILGFNELCSEEMVKEILAGP